jgi:Mitochondrial domain of unknown function (DUF1713)
LRCPAGCPDSITSALVPIRAAARGDRRGFSMGSVIKKRRKRMAKKKHRKLLKKTRVQRRNKK